MILVKINEFQDLIDQKEFTLENTSKEELHYGKVMHDLLATVQLYGFGAIYFIGWLEDAEETLNRLLTFLANKENKDKALPVLALLESSEKVKANKTYQNIMTELQGEKDQDTIHNYENVAHCNNKPNGGRQRPQHERAN